MVPIEELRINATMVEAFRNAIIGCNIGNIPSVVKRVIETEAWRYRFEAGHFYQHESFIDFITTPPLSGCGWEPAKVEALLKQAKADVDTLAAWRKAITGPRFKHYD